MYLNFRISLCYHSKLSVCRCLQQTCIDSHTKLKIPQISLKLQTQLTTLSHGLHLKLHINTDTVPFSTSYLHLLHQFKHLLRRQTCNSSCNSFWSFFRFNRVSIWTLHIQDYHKWPTCIVHMIGTHLYCTLNTQEFDMLWCSTTAETNLMDSLITISVQMP